MDPRVSTYRRLLRNLIKLQRPIMLAKRQNHIQTEISTLKYRLLGSSQNDNGMTSSRINRLQQDLKELSNDKSVLYNDDHGLLRDIYWKRNKKFLENTVTSNNSHAMTDPWPDIVQYLENEETLAKLQRDYATYASQLTQDEMIRKTANRVGLSTPEN